LNGEKKNKVIETLEESVGKLNMEKEIIINELNMVKDEFVNLEMNLRDNEEHY